MSHHLDDDIIMGDNNLRRRPGASPPQLGMRTAAADTSLKREFQIQQTKLQEMIQREMDKRLPPTLLSSITSYLSKLAPSLWEKLSPFDSKKKLKHEQSMEMSQAENSKLKRQNSGLNSSLIGLQTDNADLKSSLGKLEGENVSLKGHVSSLQGHLSSLRSLQKDHDTARRELAEERVKNAELENKTASLRSMLIPKNEVQLSDGEVQAKFTSLRSKILLLVKTGWSRDLKSLSSHNQLTQEQEMILGPFYKDPVAAVNKKYLDNCLRGVVFSILYRKIFSVRHYSLDNHVSQEVTSLGQYMCSVETYMWQVLPKDMHATIVDMRLATMKASAPWRNATQHACDAYGAIWNFFDIFQPRDKKTVDEAYQMLFNICKEAEELSLLMRSDKDEYRVDMMASALGKPLSELGALAEEEDYYPAVSDFQTVDTVAYIMTGALVKLPYDSPEDVKVLEKAQAVVYCSPTKKASNT